MDCKTARQMMDFARPRRPELDGADLEALEAHLADCPDCGPLAQVERQMDSRLSQAMRAVPIPENLRARLLTKLEMERKIRNWKRTKRWLAVPAAAAALFLSTWLGWKWLQKPEHIQIEEIAETDYGKTINPRAEQVEDYFRAEKIYTVAPADANYDLLHHYAVANFQGKQVPFLLFTDGRSDVHVYILRSKEWDLTEAAQRAPMVGSNWKAEIRFDSSGDYGYLVIYLGEGEPLKVFPKLKEKDQQSGT